MPRALPPGQGRRLDLWDHGSLADISSIRSYAFPARSRSTSSTSPWTTLGVREALRAADHLDDARLDEAGRVDEVSYRKGLRYLTVVADHDRAGAVIWVGEGKKAATLEELYDELGET